MNFIVREAFILLKLFHWEIKSLSVLCYDLISQTTNGYPFWSIKVKIGCHSLLKFDHGVVLMVPLSLLIASAASIVSIITVFLFSMYQIFLSKKCEYHQRLLNVLYFQVAIFLQLGVILNLVKILVLLVWVETEFLHFVFSKIKYFQVTSLFLYGVFIGIA